MNDLDVILIGILLAVAFYLGKMYAEWRIVKAMMDSLTPEEREKLVDAVEKAKEDKLQSLYRPVKISELDIWKNDVTMITHEVVNDIHIFYKADGTFLCQGSSLEETASRFAEVSSHPKLAVVTTEGGKKITVVNGVIKDIVARGA
jgi:hypothetical protein